MLRFSQSVAPRSTMRHAPAPPSVIATLPSSNQSRRWCFTLNNYSDDDEEAVQRMRTKYLVYGREVGANATPHLQGFVVFNSNQRLHALKALLPTAHWEITRGTSQQAADYCKKDGNFFERGQLPDAAVAGRESQQQAWADAYRLARAGDFESIGDARPDILIRSYNQLRNIHRDMQARPEAATDVTGVWMYGEPGIGKSWRARHEYPDAYLKAQNKWWDGYQSQQYVILDDFDKGGLVLAHHLKIWLDRYPFQAEYKGSSVQIRPAKIIITSNYAPSELFEDPVLAAILRRVTVIHMTEKWAPPPPVQEIDLTCDSDLEDVTN